MTGTNTATSSAGIANGFVIEGGDYDIGANQACIWINGLGAAGSGASNVRIVAPRCNMRSGTAVNAIKVSGAGTNNQIISPLVTGTLANNAIAIFTSADPGGTPTNTYIDGGMLDALNVGAGSLIVLNGTGDRVSNVQGTTGTYNWAIILAGTDQLAVNNSIPNGSVGNTAVTGRHPASPAATAPRPIGR